MGSLPYRKPHRHRDTSLPRRDGTGYRITVAVNRMCTGTVGSPRPTQWSLVVRPKCTYIKNRQIASSRVRDETGWLTSDSMRAGYSGPKAKSLVKLTDDLTLIDFDWLCWLVNDLSNTVPEYYQCFRYEYMWFFNISISGSSVEKKRWKAKYLSIILKSPRRDWKWRPAFRKGTVKRGFRLGIVRNGTTQYEVDKHESNGTTWTSWGSRSPLRHG